MDPASVYTDTISAMAVFTGVAIGLLLYLVSQQTASLWFILRVYSLGAAIVLGLAVVSLSVTPYVSFPGIVVISYLAIVIAVALNLITILWDWQGFSRRRELD